MVIYCLIFSLIESKWILPAHLAHMKYKPITPETANWFEMKQLNFKNGLDKFIHHIYAPLLAKALSLRYHTMAIFMAVLIISVGLIVSSQVKLEVFQKCRVTFCKAMSPSLMVVR